MTNDYIMNRKSLRKHCEAMCKKFKDVPTSGAYSEHRFVLDLLNQTEWILCSERLPNEEECRKNNRMFNVTDGDRSYSEWFDISKGFGEPTMYGFRIDMCVIAWQPLPEPYKENKT